LQSEIQLIKMSEAHLVDFPSLFSLKGKVAIVTGGSRGLGLTAASAYVLTLFSMFYRYPTYLTFTFILPT